MRFILRRIIIVPIFLISTLFSASSEPVKNLTEVQLHAFLGIIVNFILDGGIKTFTITTSSVVNVEENKLFAVKITNLYADGNVSYSLIGDDSNQFIINENTGEINFINAPDYETKNMYTITVKIIDSAGNEASKDITIRILDLYEVPAHKNTFNMYDNTTFSASTCTPLPIEIPVGIFVSPDGVSTGVGTQTDPLDLQTALLNNNIVKDGDTLWLMEGIYEGTFTSELRGSEGNTIKVKPYPGKYVAIDTTNAPDGAGLTINGTWTDYYGIEVTSHDKKRVSYVDNSSNPSDITLNAGVSIIGSTNKVINFVSHDNASGIDAWSKRLDGFTGIDTETYGSIIYNNGWSAQPADGSYGRGHGHAIYTQNYDGIKKITNNVIFYGFGTGIHAYQTGKVVQNGILRGIENFDIQDNTWFLTGASDIRQGMKKYDCLVGGYQPVKNLVLKNNQGYSDIGRTMLGYASNYNGDVFYNENALLDNNYLVQNLKLQDFWPLGGISIKNTSVFHGITGEQTYINDLGGNVNIPEPSSGKKIFYIKNSYDPRRGRITIFNFDRDASVAVDLSQLMKIGSAYRIHSVFDLYGEPIMSGLYSGGTINIPMGTVLPPQPYGLDGAINASEGDDPKELFGVFIVTHAGCQ
ncbi:hypothetical protein C9926_01710 [Sulfurovum lithotrophicum]|nr:hypothetical protein C9926_01710 [Sulfurovum lithotrophicum]